MTITYHIDQPVEVLSEGNWLPGTIRAIARDFEREPVTYHVRVETRDEAGHLSTFSLLTIPAIFADNRLRLPGVKPPIACCQRCGAIGDEIATEPCIGSAHVLVTG